MTAVVMSGADRLQKGLAAGQRDLRDLRRVNEQAAQTIAATARPMTPRRTGRLAASVRVASSTNGATVGSTLVYAPVIHWGWAGHNIESQPWLTDAARKSKPQWVAHYQREIERVVKNCEGV